MRSTKYVGVLTTDAELMVRSWDAWLVEATGLSEDDVRARSLLELFPEIEQRGLLPRLRRVLHDGVVEILAPAFHGYLIRCSAPGAEPHFHEMQQHVTISPLRESNTINGLCVTIEDVTARCVRERELAAQLKSQDEAIRVRAARLLSQETADPRPLLDSLEDTSWQVRQAAVSGVSRTADEDVVQRLAAVVREQNEDLGLLNAALSALTQSRVDAVPHLLPLLADPRPNVRMYTALALGNLKDARAVTTLIGLLDDNDVNVRYHAIEALGRIRAPEAAFALLPVLRARDPFLSFAALDAIGSIGERSVAPVVVELLADEALAASAVEALATIGDEKAAAALARVLDSDRVAPVGVCSTLNAIYRRFDDEYGEGALIGDVVRSEVTPDVLMHIIGSIPAANDDELVAIARVLGWLPFDGVEESLAGLMQHPRARKISLEALVERGNSAIPSLIRETRSENFEVRKAAAYGLGRIGARSATVPLVELLEDTAAEVVITAAGALGSIGDPASFDALLNLLSHDDPSIRHAAVSAINSIGHPDTAARVRALLSSDDDRVREAAVRIIGYFGNPDSLDAVLQLMSDPVEAVRRTAVEHLGYFEDERVLPALSAAIKEATPAVRAVAARALAHVGEASVDTPLQEAVRDPDPRVRYQAVQAVATQRLDDFIPTLRRIASEDKAIPVRIAAVRALGDMRDAGSVALLVSLAKHQEDDVATAALASLGQIPVAQAALALESALSGSSVRRQHAALQAIGDTHLEGLVPALQNLARLAADVAVADRAIQLLARHGSDGAIDTLLDLTANPDRRAEVIAALARVEDDVVPRMARGLRHPDARVRSATVEALARMKRPAASRMLGGALEDSDPAVRFATEQALGRLDLITPSPRQR